VFRAPTSAGRLAPTSGTMFIWTIMICNFGWATATTAASAAATASARASTFKISRWASTAAS